MATTQTTAAAIGGAAETQRRQPAVPEPLVAVPQSSVGPEREQHGQRKVHDPQAAALQAGAAEDPDMPEEPSEGGVLPPGHQEAEEGEEEPGSPVGRGSVAVAAEGAGQEGGAGHQGKEADVAGHLGQVVAVEVDGLVQGPVAPEQVGHQQQDGPLRV